MALFVATLLTTTWAGASHRGVDVLKRPSEWMVGFPYALALLTILGIHEMGHYLVARRRGVAVSLPYFIPVPSYLGTFGAFIRMEGSVRDRAAYFDVAIAGPLAGLVAAVVALWVGLPGSAAGPEHGMVPDSSLLFAGVYRLVTGSLPAGSVQLGAVAFAGWLGLIVTALNLAPVEQLDGGHIAYALLGRRGASRRWPGRPHIHETGLVRAIGFHVRIDRVRQAWRPRCRWRRAWHRGIVSAR